MVVAFAMVVTLFSATVTVIDGIIAIWIGWNVKQIQTLQERCKKNKYEIGRGELCLASFPGSPLPLLFYFSSGRGESLGTRLGCVYVNALEESDP